MDDPLKQDPSEEVTDEELTDEELTDEELADEELADEDLETEETEKESEPTGPQIGPRHASPVIIFLRALSGLGGGVIGTGIIVVIAFLGSGILKSALGTGGETIHPLFVFVFLAMVFIGSLASNLLSPLFIGLSDREKYKAISTTLYQIFIANLVILVVVAPVYMIVAGLNVGMIAAVAALQVVVSAFASAMILEIIAEYRYALLGVYATAFAVLVSAGFNFLFYSMSSGTPIILLFLALPVIWLSIGLFSGVLEYVYGLVYKLYGVDFLSSVIKYGADVRWISEEEEARIEEEKAASHGNEAGASFLSNTGKDKTPPAV